MATVTKTNSTFHEKIMRPSDFRYPEGTILSIPRKCTQRKKDAPGQIKENRAEWSGLVEAEFGGCSEIDVIGLAFDPSWIDQQDIMRDEGKKFAKTWKDVEKVSFRVEDFVRAANPISSMRIELAAAGTQAEQIAIMVRYGQILPE